MEEKKPFGTRLEAFFAGKGFYIVLFLCVAVIGVSTWSLLSGKEPTEPIGEIGVAVGHMDDEEPAIAVINPEPAIVYAPEEPAMEVQPEEVPVVQQPETPPAATEVRDYYIWPVAGAVENGYSMAALRYDRTMRDWRTHDGLDISAELGTQVKAAANGRVSAVYADDRYGTTVVITHQNGLETTYCNLAAEPTVAAGDQVGVGQVIGAVGDTALCEIGEVSHLHFAMTKDGESVDPTNFMP